MSYEFMTQILEPLTMEIEALEKERDRLKQEDVVNKRIIRSLEEEATVASTFLAWLASGRPALERPDHAIPLGISSDLWRSIPR